MADPVVTIRPYWFQNNPGTEIFIDYAGLRFYSRNWVSLNDSPHTKAAIGQEFLSRLARHPSTIIGNVP